MARLEYNKYNIEVKTLRIPRRVKKALKNGLPYKIGFITKKYHTGTVLTPKIKIQK